MAILPGSKIGILGGGQLGRMFVVAARTMGYEVIVLDPDPLSPAGSMATQHLAAAYDDHDALDELARQCAVLTTEFENIPADSLRYLARYKPVHPSAAALEVTQNRIREKTFIQQLGLDTAAFIPVESFESLVDLDAFRFPAILKTATLGYDGKGQAVCNNAADVREAFGVLNSACILERFVELDKEISIVLARSQHGEVLCYPPAENRHANGILDVSSVPAAVSPAIERQAIEYANAIATGLDYCGVLAVEFFITTDGQLLVNEIAPRPHNSGHYTLDACYTSQFEQQVRMICALPPGNAGCHTPVAMLNILGDIWPARGAPPWEGLLSIDRAYLHLYGKKEARPGRKMGHINFLAPDIASALKKLEQGRSVIVSQNLGQPGTIA